MERLTRKLPGGYAMAEGYALDTLKGVRAAVNRLAAYEDTGLTPEEVQKMRWIPVEERLPEPNTGDGYWHGEPSKREEIPAWFLRAAKEKGAKIVANLTPGKLYLGQSYTDFFLEFDDRKPRADCVEWYFENRRALGIGFSGAGGLVAFEATEPKVENLEGKCEHWDPHGWITKEFLRTLEEASHD